MSNFKQWLVVSILRFQKCFDVVVLNFQIDVLCRYFGVLGRFLSLISGHPDIE
jgi:hypothetical protein